MWTFMYVERKAQKYSLKTEIIAEHKDTNKHF